MLALAPDGCCPHETLWRTVFNNNSNGMVVVVVAVVVALLLLVLLLLLCYCFWMAQELLMIGTIPHKELRALEEAGSVGTGPGAEHDS